MPTSSQVPVEVLLKLVTDKVGEQGVKDMLDRTEGSFSRIEQIVGRMSSSFEGLLRTGMNLAGIAGVGGIAQQFVQTSQAGSNVALAGGMVTGGPSVWHPYGQALLSA